MPIVPMSCPKCGRQATEYDAHKWQCLHCGIKFVYKEEKAPVINVHQLYQSGETVRPVMCCPKCGSTNVRLQSLDDSRRGDFNIFGTLVLGDLWNETVRCLACGGTFFTPEGQRKIVERERQKRLTSERKVERAREWEESRKAMGTSLANAGRGVRRLVVDAPRQIDHLLWTMVGGEENTILHHFLLVLMVGIAIAVLIGLGIVVFQ